MCIRDSIRIFGDYFNKFDTEEIEQLLIGKAHHEEAIRTALAHINISDYFSNLTMEEFLQGIF